MWAPSRGRARVIHEHARRPGADGDRGGRDRRGDAGQRDAASCARALRERARPGRFAAVVVNGVLPAAVHAAPRPDAASGVARPRRAPCAPRWPMAAWARAHRAQVARLRRGLRGAPRGPSPSRSCSSSRARARARSRGSARGAGPMSDLAHGWRASASASARAPAASARRRPRPRSRWGWRRAARGSRVVTIDPARRLADALGLERARQRAARASTPRASPSRDRDARASCGR